MRYILVAGTTMGPFDWQRPPDQAGGVDQAR
jgi:hypothetical protein